MTENQDTKTKLTGADEGLPTAVCYLGCIVWIDYGGNRKPFAASIKGQRLKYDSDQVECYGYHQLNSGIIGSAKPEDIRPLKDHSDHEKLKEAVLNYRLRKAKSLIADNALSIAARRVGR